MATKYKKIMTDEAILPGEHLRDILKHKGITQKELAQRMGRPEKTISGIINGNVRITPDTALQMESVLEISAKFWMNLESDYQLTKAYIKELEALQPDIGFLRTIPVNELLKRKLVEPYRDKIFQLREVLRFLKVPSVDLIEPNYQAVYRSTDKTRIHPEIVALWLREGQNIAEQMDLPPFNIRALKKKLDEIRNLTLEGPEIFELALNEILKSSGVGLVLVREYPGGWVNGAFYKLNGNPFIQVCLRGKYADIFWFSLFHEIGHVILHSKEEIIVDYEGDSGKKEDEANSFASETLIPKEKYEEILKKRIPTDQGFGYKKTDVIEFANEIGVHPGIVVGRLQHDGGLPETHLNRSRVKLDWK